eukprot:135257_1
MLFTNIASDEGTIQHKHLSDFILVVFNSLFLLHVTLSIVITINCYEDNELSYVWLLSIVFMLCLISSLYILFKLNAFVIFYLWKLLVGILIFIIPFILLSIVFPILCVLFAFIKYKCNKSIEFITNFWSHSTNYIIFCQLVLTIPHTLIYNIILFNYPFITKQYTHNNYPIIISCIIIGTIHWTVCILYYIYHYNKQNKLIELTHLIFWNSICLQIFLIYFYIIGCFLISLASSIFWFFLLICSIPMSIIYLTYKYRKTKLINESWSWSNDNIFMQWAIINPIIVGDNNTKKIEQKIYCMKHIQYHEQHTPGNKSNNGNELDHLLSDNDNKKEIFKIHKNGDDECIKYQFKYIDNEQTFKAMYKPNKSIYDQIKLYFGIKSKQIYKVCLLLVWISCVVIIYCSFPLICLINSGVYDNSIVQFYVVLLFVMYALLGLFYLVIIHNVYCIEYYLNLMKGCYTNITNDGCQLSVAMDFNEILERNMVIYKCLSIGNHDGYTMIIPMTVIMYLGTSLRK